MSESGPPVALWLLPVSDVGGVGRHALDVAKVGLPGHRLVVLLPPGPVAAQLQRLGVEVHTGPVDPASGIPAGLRTLRSVMQQVRPAVVHSHLSYADLLVALGGHGALRVSTEHGIARDDLVYHGSPAKARIKATAHTLRVRRFNRLLAVSASTKAVMTTKWRVRQPISVVLNGVDRPDPTPDPSPGWRFLSLSRLAPEKRIAELLQAFSLVHQQEPSARLTIAGTGPLAASLQAQTMRLGLSDAVTFPGVVDATEALREHDVVTQLSVWENASYTLLDAVTHGLGVVATPVGGNVEIVGERSLAQSLAPTAVAALMRTQATELAARPQLSADWPTVPQMAARIATNYEVVQR